MHIAFFIGIENLLLVELDLERGALSFVEQALNEINNKLERWKSEGIPTFGRPTGFVVNYSPNQAIRFDLNGKPVETWDRAQRLGKLEFAIGKRPVSSSQIHAVFDGRLGEVHAD